MKWILIIEGGMYEEAWERCVGIYDTFEEAEKAEKEMNKILSEHIPSPNKFRSDLDANCCFIYEVEENPDLSTISIEWQKGEGK